MNLSSFVCCVSASSLLIVAACGSVAPTGDAGLAIDAPATTPDATSICSPTATFDAPVELTGFVSSDYDYTSGRLSPDELTLYFGMSTVRQDFYDLYVAQRSSLGQPFGAPVPLSSVDTSSDEWDPTVSSAGLTLIFGSDRTAGEGDHLFVAARSSTLGTFAAPSLLAGVNSATVTDLDGQPFLTADGQELWFISNRAGGMGALDLWRATRSGSSFATPTVVSELSSSADDEEPILSADRLTVYFGSTRAAAGAPGDMNIWTSHRASVADSFPPPTQVTELDGPTVSVPSWLSPDDCRLYLWSTRDTNSLGLYVATRHP